MSSGMHPSEVLDRRLGRNAEQDSLKLDVTDVDVAGPQLVVFRVAGSLDYANAESFMGEVLLWIKSTTPTPRWFVLRFDSLEGVDYVAAKALMELADRMRNRGVTVVFAELTTELRNFFLDAGVLEAIGPDMVFASFEAALAAYHQLEQKLLGL